MNENGYNTDENEYKMDTVWIKMDIVWMSMDTKWMKMDTKWIQNGYKMDTKCTEVISVHFMSPFSLVNFHQLQISFLG